MQVCAGGAQPPHQRLKGDVIYKKVQNNSQMNDQIIIYHAYFINLSILSNASSALSLLNLS